MFARAYWKETGRATGEVALSIHTHAYTHVKINQHNFTGIDNSMAYPADVVIASGAYMVRHRSRRRLVLRGCIPRSDLRSRSLRLAGCVSKLPNLYKYLTRVDNPMTYPADVVIRSGAYMVRQRSRRRLAHPPWMHTTF